MTAVKALRTPRAVVQPSPIPFYAQVRDALRQMIMDGTYQPHQQMPSENEMVELFRVSRITIRQALTELQNEGLIFRIHGKGTFVSKPKAFQELKRLQSFGEAMQPMGYETYSKLISVREIEPSPQVRARLNLASRERAVEIRRVRYLNRDPLSLDVSYFPLALGHRLQDEDLAGRDIFLIFEQDYGIRLGHAELVIGAHLADELQGRLLGIEEGSPLLFIDRLTHDDSGTPLDYEHLYYRGDAFRYRVSINRTGGDPRGSQSPIKRSSTGTRRSMKRRIPR
jgi:GntR family transcriptional regulator